MNLLKKTGLLCVCLLICLTGGLAAWNVHAGNTGLRTYLLMACPVIIWAAWRMLTERPGKGV